MANGFQTIPTTGEIMTTGTLSTWLPREKLRGSPKRTAAKYASGTLWPHGEWSLGYGAEREDGGPWHEDPFVGLGVDDVGMAESAAKGRRPLNLSDAANSHTPSRRGLKGMSSYGQQMVKAAGHLMQEKFPHHRKTLGTITLPPMPEAARVEVVEAWPELTRQLLQWLARGLRRLGLPEVIVSVSEIQPKRLVESGEGYLHWHLLWLNVPAKSGHWSFDPNVVRSWVDSLLKRRIPSYTGGHVNVNTKAVEGTVAAYLAKYMSKGKQMVSEAVKDWGEGNCPRTWWNMTKPIRDAVKAAVCRGRETGNLLQTCLDYMWETGDTEAYAFIRPIEIEYDNSRILMGWRGRFIPDVMPGLTAMLKSSHMGGLQAPRVAV